MKALDVFKRLALLGSVSVLAMCQGTGQGVVNVILNNGTTAYTVTTTLAYNSIQNIGQTSHIVNIRVGTVVGVWNLSTVMQGSTDCINYTNIGPVTTDSVYKIVSTGQTFTAIGYGSYPCIGVKTILTKSGGTSVSGLYINYSGNSSPSLTNVDQFNSNNGLLYQNTGSPLAYSSATALVTSLGTNNLVFYGLQGSFPSTVTEVSIYCSPDGTTVTGQLAMIMNFAAYQYILPPGVRSYGACPSGSSIYYNATGSGSASSMQVQYRYE